MSAFTSFHLRIHSKQLSTYYVPGMILSAEDIEIFYRGSGDKILAWRQQTSKSGGNNAIKKQFRVMGYSDRKIPFYTV